MSAIDIVKEIAPAVARRRVQRGFRWLMEREQSFPVSMWLWNPRIYVPREESLHGEHMLVTVFSNTFAQRPRRSFDELVAEFGLSKQFLIAHGFCADEVIDEAMLDFCWREGVFYLHLEREAPRIPSALSPELRSTLTH